MVRGHHSFGSLTDTLIVVSLDPVGRTVSMVSIPRDLVNVPLGNGTTYAAIAAEVIVGAIVGRPDVDADIYKFSDHHKVS